MAEDHDFVGPEEDFLGPLEDPQLVAHGVVNYEWLLVAVLCVLLLLVWAATALVWYCNADILTRVYSHPDEFEIHADRIAASCRDVVAGVDIKALASNSHRSAPAAAVRAPSPLLAPLAVQQAAPRVRAAPTVMPAEDAVARAQLDIRTAVDMQRMAATPFIAPERDEEEVLLRARVHRDTVGDERDVDGFGAALASLDTDVVPPGGQLDTSLVYTPAGHDSVAATPAASAAQQLLRAMDAVSLIDSTTSSTLRHRRMGRSEHDGAGSPAVPGAPLDSTRMPHHIHASMSFSSAGGGVE